MAVVWLQCGRRCGGRRAVPTPPCDPRARGARQLQRAVLTGPQPQCIGLPAAGARQFFRYCLGLRGGGSSHFAPICTAKLRRDQSSGGGGWDKCTECHINHGHRGLSLSLCLTHTYFVHSHHPDSDTSHSAAGVSQTDTFLFTTFFLTHISTA